MKPEDHPPPAPPPRPLEPFTGSHGGTINAIGVAADGTAAATGDQTGGLRLWPTLDGTREPIVIKGPVAAALAIGHDGSGYAIAVTDAADQVELIRTDAKGNIRTRTKLGEAIQLEVVGDAVLALRVDQMIDHIAFDGTLRGRLAADPGTQIKSLVVRDGKALAIVKDEKQTRARWIELPATTWGARSAPLAMSADAQAVLSADGDAIAVLDEKGDRIMRFELATGTAKPACPQSTNTFRGRRFSGEFGGGFGAVLDEPVGFVGHRVACFVDNVMSWWDLDKGEALPIAGEAGQSSAVFAAASDRVVVAISHQLALHAPQRVDFLGYGFRDLTHVRAVPTGLMIGKGDQEPVLLDEKFRERARFSLPKLRVDWTDLIPMDDRYVIASSTRTGGTDLWGSAYQIAVYDTVKQAMHQVLPERARTGELTFEPATQLLLASDGNKTVLVRFDPATHTLGNEVALELNGVPKQVALLDPTLAGGGKLALAIKDEGSGGLLISEIYARDLPRAEASGVAMSMRPRTTYRIAGELRAVDRSGRLYVYNPMHPDDIGVYEGGTHRTQLAGAAKARLRPSPDGKHVVAVDGGRIVLFTDGKRRWETAAWGSSDVDWTSAGTLYARFPHALARIDVETGALEERQCGWAFGISTTSRDASSDAPSVCDVAP